jgi:hypothetical protein
MLATSKVLLSSALLLAAIPAFATEGTSSVAPVALPSATVKCPGGINVPLTSDPEQSLPLLLVTSLNCGERVVVLSDTEGYTARIRTVSGKEGYVARMYLKENDGSTPAAAPVEQRPSSATPVNGVVRWAEGAPGCDDFVSRGRHVESITANGITVQVSVQDTGWKYRASIAISNASSNNVDVTPGIITLDELQPRLRTLPATDTKVIARTATHQVFWTLADAVPSPSAVDSHAASMRQAAYRPAAPDYLNTHVFSADRPETVDVPAVGLKYASVAAGEKTAGVMWFARDPGARELSLRVPVGDMVFDFAFAFEQKK